MVRFVDQDPAKLGGFVAVDPLNLVTQFGLS